MKRLIIPMIAALAMVATSCSSDEPGAMNSGDECTVTISAALPQEMGTRSFADATTAEKLQYAIYESGTKTKLSEGVTVFNGQLSADLELRLAVGRTYDICFWASANNSPYTFDPKTQQVKVDYEGATCNDENRDAFYYMLKGLKVEGSVSESVTLKRPFAQLNFGTNDKTQALNSGVQMNTSKIVVDGVYSTFDLSTGNVEGETSKVTFSCASIPVAESFPVTGYDYLAMSYLLVPADKGVVDATLVTADSRGNQSFEHTYTALPVQGNYRTNVYGSLFTAPADFTVTKDQSFTGDYDGLVDSSVELAAEASIEDNVVNLAPGITLMMPSNIAKGVTINGNGASVYSSSENPIVNDDITIKNTYLKFYSGNTVEVKANGFALEDCTIEVGNAAVNVTTGYTATVSGCKFVGYITNCGNYGVYLEKGASVVLNSCVYERGSALFCINSASDTTVEANNCVFSGWMSGWQAGGTFTNCTFRYGYQWYPDAICYGNTVFDGCKFEYVGSSYISDESPVDGDYGFNYVVSGRGPKIEFNNCTYTSTLVPEYEGKAVDSYIYHPGQGDDKTDAKEVYINGKLVFSQATGRIAD